MAWVGLHTIKSNAISALSFLSTEHNALNFDVMIDQLDLNTILLFVCVKFDNSILSWQ